MFPASGVFISDCAAGIYCEMKGVFMEGVSHKCMNCSKAMHGALCGIAWEERGSECKLSTKALLDLGNQNKDSRGALICAICMRG